MPRAKLSRTSHEFPGNSTLSDAPERLVVVYDANILYSAVLCDLFMRLATAGLVRAHWTDQIHEEWIRAVLARRTDLSREQLTRRRDAMDRAVPGALVTEYEHLIPTLELPDPDDRHVLAAAIVANAQVIVTKNTKDFPNAVLDPRGVVASGPNGFLLELLGTRHEEMLEVVADHRRSMVAPPRGVDEHLDAYRRNDLTTFADAVAAFRDRL
jgi:predicted nucleic acid-binding protein